ncbi:hypothetical protein C3941_05020 [Kaistia algarum]|uniref:PRC-barrel domain-containing protein n=1 Tax=Kaistia algarum TaxID=2083279 RepID=UPI000CE797EF|nr:PRC-barrel domain-containing protein [Kaistia algarum]MCX5515957.1 PRC-barrel domain-containing protein [Kaistia algarum]PPE80681.1 hypothetical protein C3941_05020 [Kaistia algarum]
MKKILAATALAGFLAAGPAFAQDATTPAPAPAATTDMSATTAMTERFITLQAPDDWLAARLIGSTVYSPADDNLGDINDLVVASNGTVKAVVIGVGGFLGIGEKNVAINPTALERVADGNTVKYRLATTKEELTAAPEFKPLDAADVSTTGSTTPAPMDPAPTPATPAQ